MNFRVSMCKCVLANGYCNVQVRIQLGQGSAVTVAKGMIKNEGVGSFYKV